jgi:hypothetical protein
MTMKERLGASLVNGANHSTSSCQNNRKIVIFGPYMKYLQNVFKFENPTWRRGRRVWRA